MNPGYTGNNVLLIYTGGTIGMMHDPETHHLRPFDFESLTTHIPELKKLDIHLSSIAFEQPIDSSNMSPAIWAKLANMIYENYAGYDGFVILHGSDTMAYTASALSFMLRGIAKPVILTGSQLPIGTIRTDGKENIITAIEIAASKNGAEPVVPEVAIYFEYRLHRGNRTSKVSATHFNAFSSGNYPLLAEAGVNIDYNYAAIQKPAGDALTLFTEFDPHVAILKIFPGIQAAFIEQFLAQTALHGLIIETFGSGNMTTDPAVIAAFAKFIAAGKPVINVTQCHTGFVEQGKYETSTGLARSGVISAHDMTTEAALAKLMYALGRNMNTEAVRIAFDTGYCGEVTP